MSCSWFSGTAVMVDADSVGQAAAVAAFLGSHLDGVRARAGLAYVLVEPVTPDASLLERVSSVLAGFGRGELLPGPAGRECVFEVRYDGDDLDMVARELGIAPAEVVAHHQATRWQVLMLGFAPGFGYLGAVDPTIDWTALARLDRPRRAVPEGAIGVAAGMSCVYPSGMPGGWPLIGGTKARLFDPDDEQDPTLLHPGDLVRFIEVT